MGTADTVVWGLVRIAGVWMCVIMANRSLDWLYERAMRRLREHEKEEPSP
jgi:hypothetical protein